MNCSECLFRIDDKINNVAVCGIDLKFYPDQQCGCKLYPRIIELLQRRIFEKEITIKYNLDKH